MSYENDHEEFIQKSDQDSIEYTVDGKGIERLSRVKVYGNVQREGINEFAARSQALFNAAKLEFEEMGLE